MKSSNRVIMEYTTIMTHEVRRAPTLMQALPSATVEQLEKDILDSQINARETKRQGEVMVDMLSDLTGQPKEKLRADLANDKFMSPAEAVEYRLADMVRARKPRPLPVKTRATEVAGGAADDDVTVVEAPALTVRGTPAAPAAS